MDMPRVNKCEVTDCAYNKDKCCHAMAITVGNTVHPKCDTFCQSMVQGGDLACIAGVGSCKVSSCKFNKHLECQAPGIWVGYRQDEPDCMTFDEK